MEKQWRCILKVKIKVYSPFDLAQIVDCKLYDLLSCRIEVDFVYFEQYRSVNEGMIGYGIEMNNEVNDVLESEKAFVSERKHVVMKEYEIVDTIDYCWCCYEDLLYNVLEFLRMQHLCDFDENHAHNRDLHNDYIDLHLFDVYLNCIEVHHDNLHIEHVDVFEFVVEIDDDDNFPMEAEEVKHIENG